MTAVIYGAGAIGCHIAYCLYITGHKVYLISRGDHLNQMKKKGLSIEIKKNNDFIKNSVITEDKNFKVLTDVRDLKSENIDYIFISLKLKDYNQQCFKDIISITKDNTAILPPCTNLPFWWLQSQENKIGKNFSDFTSANRSNPSFNPQNIIGMTMWLSAVVDSPGRVTVKHVQRGYPLKEIFPKMKKKADTLREIFNKTCVSPVVKNIYSEIFTKSLNALAFNLVALDREFNNSQLKEDKDSVFAISKIMNEGEQIIKILNITLHQTIQERIEQTLSSSIHTMSMLSDYKKGKGIELKYLWESYQNVINYMNIKMEYTQALITKVLDKTNR